EPACLRGSAGKNLQRQKNPQPHPCGVRKKRPAGSRASAEKTDWGSPGRPAADRQRRAKLLPGAKQKGRGSLRALFVCWWLWPQLAAAGLAPPLALSRSSEITGQNSMKSAPTTSVPTSQFEKKTVTSPWVISIAWRNELSAMSPSTSAS